MRRGLICSKCSGTRFLERQNGKYRYCADCNVARHHKWKSGNTGTYKYSAYRQWDRAHGYEFNLSRAYVDEQMSAACFYCTRTPALGLDRKDSALGHTEDNTVPCCEKCNYILGDIPFEAKKLLARSLCEVFEAGALESWMIPTKRKK